MAKPVAKSDRPDSPPPPGFARAKPPYAGAAPGGLSAFPPCSGRGEQGRNPAGLIVGALAGLAAAWIAAGDAGLLHYALRHALMWVAMLAAVVACWPEKRGLGATLWIVAAAVAAVVMTASSLAPVNVMAAPVLLAGLAWGRTGRDRRVLALAAQAVAIFGIYRIAVTSIPTLWILMDSVGGWLGLVGGKIAGRPLSIGATFAGVDVLVLAGAFYGLWLVATPAPRLARGLWAAGAIVAGHLLYLTLLAYAPDLMAAIPVPPPEPGRTYVLPSDIPPWSFWEAVATLLPWNFVALAGIIQLIVAGAMLRWAQPPDSGYATSPLFSGAVGIVVAAAVLGAAVLLPLATVRYSQPASLEGKKFVVNQEGFLNWLRPEHGEYGRLAIGMYGMLPDLVASYGGTLVKTTEFSDAELKSADAVIIIFPNKPWKKGQLERIWKFVAGGGTLLLVADHTTRDAVPDLDNTPNQPLPPGYTVVATSALAPGVPEIGSTIGSDKFVVLSPEGEVFAHSLADTEDEAVRNVRLKIGTRFNDVLFPTAIRVNFDTAEWAIGGWLDCYEAMAHPTTTWSPSDRNDFGVVIGASLNVRSPARPLILGKWGWNDLGDTGSPRAMLGNGKYDAGERLGNVFLAAEQPFGKGKVIVFGDTSTLTNGINIGSYGYTGSLLAYAAGRTSAPPWDWQLLGFLAALVAIAALAVRPPLWLTGATALAAAVILAACFSVTHAMNTPVPQGRPERPIAYIDMSHLEAFSQEGLRDDGMMGLELTLMRNGYLTLAMSDFSDEALQQAAVFVSVAPAREFTAAEREAVRRFVERGGIFICTVGWDERLGSQRLLADFGLRVGQPGDPTREPSPFGHFKAPFIQVGNEMHFVRFHAGWPVAADLPPGSPEAVPLGYGADNVPVILMRPVGQGKVVLIGDTCFAMNKNLEHMDGSPFERMRENADFWRWLISFLRGGQEWLPPPNVPPLAEPQPAAPPPAASPPAAPPPAPPSEVLP